MKLKTLTALALAATLQTGAALADDTIKFGAIATLEGPFAVLGQEGIRGVELAIEEFGGEVAGKKIELMVGSSNAQPDTAVAAARKLVEQDGAQIVIGPLSGSEGLAIKDYSKTQPQASFLNGGSAAQDTTLRDPSENFFRWNPDGAQWVAGLGEYTFKEKGYRNIAIVAEDYSFPYTLVFGFMKPYCELGGKVAERFWVPLGTKDYSSVIASIPDDIDAILVTLGGSDAINFLSQYQQAGGEKPMVAGSITVDQSVLSSKGRSKDYLIGTPTSSPVADTNTAKEWTDFVSAYQAKFPEGLPTPSLFAQEYYVSTKAALLALQEVDGDLSDQQKAFRAALSDLTFLTPAGERHLDENRQVVTDIFLSEIRPGEDGGLVSELISVIPQVNQTLGDDRETFLAYGPVGRDNPECK
ncbi:ABC transporter substrate-binding protein [Labrenzia sp. 011]|uniref:ABC transporter substrate-binding protein n=1 Tax=Labrenzia sp. 011 TaxID=2171494 RepID=UPI000D519580|nr:ABC transporter substrate-binding protein [Labrenzia sp. 011]PVB62411.1 ABC transporter substrate-binding protein [Labrenzia sp. 011]